MVNHPNRKLSPSVRAFLSSVTQATDVGRHYAVDETDERELRRARLCEREGWVTTMCLKEAELLVTITETGRAAGLRSGEP